MHSPHLNAYRTVKFSACVIRLAKSHDNVRLKLKNKNIPQPYFRKNEQIERLVLKEMVAHKNTVPDRTYTLLCAHQLGTFAPSDCVSNATLQNGTQYCFCLFNIIKIDLSITASEPDLSAVVSVIRPNGM